MPRAVPINPDLIRAIFAYDPDTGALTPKPTAPLVARRTDKNQWEVNGHRHMTHRLVWAWHNPDNPNPYSVQCKDGNRHNTRIENLYSISTNPRWIGHVKQVKGRFDSAGRIILAGDTSAPTPTPAATSTPKRVQDPTPEPVHDVDTTFIGELESMMTPPTPKPTN